MKTNIYYTNEFRTNKLNSLIGEDDYYFVEDELVQKSLVADEIEDFRINYAGDDGADLTLKIYSANVKFDFNGYDFIANKRDLLCKVSVSCSRCGFKIEEKK